MRSIFDVEAVRDPLLLLSRILMTLLFLVFGWQKLTAFSGTAAYFAHLDVPFPTIATSIAIVVELGSGIAIMLGLFTRPIAFALAIYTIIVALIGHEFWALSGPEQVNAEIHFFKNVSIMGGLFVLFITGAGRYSLDSMFDIDRSRIWSGAARKDRQSAWR